MKTKTKLWEYLILDNLNNIKLNDLGVNGWELVSVVFFPKYTITTYYFKKQIR